MLELAVSNSVFSFVYSQVPIKRVNFINENNSSVFIQFLPVFVEIYKRVGQNSRKGPNKQVGWKNLLFEKGGKSASRVGEKSENANRVDLFIWMK